MTTMTAAAAAPKCFLMRLIKTATAQQKRIQWIRFIRFLSSSSSCIIVLAIHFTERVRELATGGDDDDGGMVHHQHPTTLP